MAKLTWNISEFSLVISTLLCFMPGRVFADDTDYVVIIYGVSIGISLLIAASIAVCCVCCPCCIFYKRRHPQIYQGNQTAGVQHVTQTQFTNQVHQGYPQTGFAYTNGQNAGAPPGNDNMNQRAPPPYATRGDSANYPKQQAYNYDD